MLLISFLYIVNDISLLLIITIYRILVKCFGWKFLRTSKIACGEGDLMVDYLVKMTNPQLKRMDIVKDEPAINPRMTTVPRSYRTGDRFAGRRVVTIGGGSGTFSV